MSAPPKRNIAPVPPRSQQSTSVVRFGTVPKMKAHRIVLYGTGGIGKTTLECLAPGPVAHLDADESLPALKDGFEAQGIPLPHLIQANSFPEVRAQLQASGWEGIKTIGLDITKVEEWAAAHTLKTVKHPDKNIFVNSVEGYGFGKGFQFVFDTFMPLLADLDRHVREGRNVILVAHECTHVVPNPRGDDFLRYEPRLQDPSSGKASIRLRIKEWCDHMLFLAYDIDAKDGKAAGAGTRTLYTAELPFCMAKSRTTGGASFDVKLGDGSVWDNIIK